MSACVWTMGAILVVSMKRIVTPLLFFLILVCVGFVARVLFDFSATDVVRTDGGGGLVNSPLIRNASLQVPLAPVAMHTNFGDWDEEQLVAMMLLFDDSLAVGNRIDFISERFLGTPYEGNTLVGSADVPEKLTVHLSGLDCFTYLDYVEAARQSDSYNAFLDSLRDVRYKDGVVAYQHRKHFFSDWVAHDGERVRDVTQEVGRDVAVSVEKYLNQKKDGGVFLDGIPVVTRTVTHIPTDAITEEVVGNLRTGDYIGVYTDIDGLDVTHTGILIKYPDGTPHFRHASSRKDVQRVLDDPLLEYLDGKPGIVVYRAY